MTRETVDGRHGDPWVMRCDRTGVDRCTTTSDPRPAQHHLPLSEFADAGWYIARTYGDLCPACVAALGGMAKVVEDRRNSGTSGPAAVTLARLDVTS